MVHHFDTVVGAHPNCLDSQRLDIFFSTSTTFKRLRSLLATILHILINATKLQNSSQNKDKSYKKVQKSMILMEKQGDRFLFLKPPPSNTTTLHPHLLHAVSVHSEAMIG